MASTEPEVNAAAEAGAAPPDPTDAPPLTMVDAVGRLTPDQAGLLGVLLGLQRLED
ncbi:hypothetical protein [Streptacidiphilus monticola]|uniref:Uncharacterized protein n=1 Tax=Streptacidiphilus monticola TaxID=2161674 RepID=A0ABW1FYL8_9ACTN